MIDGVRLSAGRHARCLRSQGRRRSEEIARLAVRRGHSGWTFHMIEESGTGEADPVARGREAMATNDREKVGRTARAGRRATAEQWRETSERARDVAETDRESAEQGRNIAEELRDSAERLRAQSGYDALRLEELLRRADRTLRGLQVATRRAEAVLAALQQATERTNVAAEALLGAAQEERQMTRDVLDATPADKPRLRE